MQQQRARICPVCTQFLNQLSALSAEAHTKTSLLTAMPGSGQLDRFALLVEDVRRLKAKWGDVQELYLRHKRDGCDAGRVADSSFPPPRLTYCPETVGIDISGQSASGPVFQVADRAVHFAAVGLRDTFPHGGTEARIFGEQA